MATQTTYACGLAAFARCFNVPSVDVLVSKIKANEIDPYKTLDKFVAQLLGSGAAPKTTWIYLTSVKALFDYEEIVLEKRKLRKIRLPAKVEISVDRIPTREEMRNLLLNSNQRTRALIALLATTGLRIGEVANLRIANLDLLGNKVTVVANRTKSRRTRTSFFTNETAGFIRSYLGKRIDKKDEWLFPDPDDSTRPARRGALYMRFLRVLTKQGLDKKLDPDSRMKELHPHALRKYFFSKLIGAGVDRGIAEYLMGHKFGLDNAYLRMDEERLRKEYAKAEPDFIFLTETRNDKKAQTEIDGLHDQLQELRLAVRMLQDASGFRVMSASENKPHP